MLFIQSMNIFQFSVSFEIFAFQPTFSSTRSNSKSTIHSSSNYHGHVLDRSTNYDFFQTNSIKYNQFNKVATSSTLYYKNLEEYEEKQQQEDVMRSKTKQDEGIRGNLSSSELSEPVQREELTVLLKQDETMTTIHQPMINTTATARTQSVVPTSFLSSSSSQQLPRTIDLPKSFLIKNDKAKNDEIREKLLSYEMMIGRIAMVSAMYLIVEELVTGSSALDQIQNLAI